MNALSKKLMLAAWIAVVSTLSFAQGLEPGNLIGVHVATVTLNPNATMDDFTKFYVEQVLPEYEKAWPGLKGYLLKSFFRDSKNKFAIVRSEEHTSELQSHSDLV